MYSMDIDVIYIYIMVFGINKSKKENVVRYGSTFKESNSLLFILFNRPPVLVTMVI